MKFQNKAQMRCISKLDFNYMRVVESIIANNLALNDNLIYSFSNAQ